MRDRYGVVEHPGSGGMGDVFELERTVLKLRLALKRLASHGASESAAGERSLRQARTAVATGHEGVVEVFDPGVDATGVPFLVMELLAGTSLRRRSSLGAPAPADVIVPAHGILEPLDAVHARGVAPRDLKPANLLLVPTTFASTRP